MSKITRDKIVPLIDTANKWTKASQTGATFVPIDLSTTFELEYNPVTDTVGYICYKNDFTTHTGYQPAMDQEIALDDSNPMYKFINGLRHSLPVGSDAEFPVLIAEPGDTGGTTFGQVWEHALITVDTLNSVDGVLTFNLALNGDPVDVTVTGLGTDSITVAPKK